jgi:hypothetical protein
MRGDPLLLVLRHVLLAQSEADILVHREPGEQRIGLKHHSPVRARCDDRRAVEQNAPVVGVSRPATIRSSVDLPHPEVRGS